MKRRFTFRFVPISALLLLFSLQAVVVCSPGRQNIARGCPYRWNRAPNYHLCTDPGDRQQLTDGILSQGYFWVQKETVGWVHVKPVIVTVDLGAVRAVGGASLRTAYGTAGVLPPQAVYVFVSRSGKTYRYLGDLVALSNRVRKAPLESSYAVHVYKSFQLKGKGRYVVFAAVPRGPFFFCDELQIYEGEKGLQVQGEAVGDVAAWVTGRQVLAGLKERLRRDCAVLEEKARACLAPGRRSAMLGKIAAVKERVEKLTSVPSGFRSVVPAHLLHKEIFRLHAAVLRACGFSGLVLWHCHRYAPLDPFSEPQRSPPRLSFWLMRGEYRADVLNLTNATQSDIQVTVRCENIPGAPVPSYLACYEVLFVDTSQGKVIADALVKLPVRQGSWKVHVPSGMTKQVWFSLCFKKENPGRYKGSLVVSSPAGTERVPVVLAFSRLSFPERTRLALGLWDYTDDPPAYDITVRNRAPAIRNMQEHFINAPWARRSVLPWPRGEDFDAAQRLTRPLAFENLRRWFSRWPNARWYCIFLSVGKGSFAGVSYTDPRFIPRLKTWAEAVRAEITALGKSPAQVAFLILDEPHSQAQDRIILAWAKALKMVCPEFVIWEDPTYRKPEKEALRAAYAACDILCPNLAIFLGGSEESRRFYMDLLREGRRSLWFYQCAGPARLLDPSRYHRLQAWQCFRYGATGSGFWAYGDSGNSPWNVYAASRTIYSPVYLGEEDVTEGKHFEAIREGVEDYEYLAMVRDVTERTTDTRLRSEGKRVLQEALREAIPPFEPAALRWHTPKRYGACDRARLNLLEFLSGP